MRLYGPHTFVWQKMLISNDFSSEASGPVLLKFHVEPPWGRRTKNGRGPLVKMAAMSINGKKFSPEPNKNWALIFAQIIGDRSSIKIAKMMV